jgi:hypothetical protein
MYKIKREVNILGREIFYFRVLKKKWFLFIPFFSKNVFSRDGYGRFLITKTKEESQTLIDILNK